MFSVHDVTGQTVHAPLERLFEVPGVIRARAIRPIAREGEELGPEYFIGAPHARYAEAAAAYAKARHQEQERGPVRHAYQVMSRDVLILQVTDSLATAWRALLARRVYQAPVLNAAMDIVGLVSERDLLTVIDFEGATLSGGLNRTVGEVMTSPAICADPVTDIRRIAHVLLDTGLSAVPVTNDMNVLLGVVSRGDILRAAVADPPLSLWV